MKTVFITYLFLISTAFLVTNETTEPAPKETLQGVWELVNQQIYENGNVKEILENENGYRQVKMYSKGRVMWTRNDPSDTNEWFGYGTYTIKDGILEERLEYASGPMMKIVDTTQIFRFELILDKNSYQQISIDKDGAQTQGESYKRIE